MELDAAHCYRVVLSRDHRFDGRFFGGVVTTGVYCRPVCPVHPPKPENVRWFPSAAAAEAAGFRPCRRCRPETSPGTPAWMGTSATVSRALRLIADGALDDDDVEALGGRLGLSSRQLRRLFVEHLGAAPVAVARARRVHFAAKLLAETQLSITQVALAAGFQSIRQFNHDVRATFGRPPTQLRARRNGGGPLSDDGQSGNGSGLIVRLPYRPPFDWAAVSRFLKTRATPGVEAVEDDTYRRTITVDGAPGTIEVWPVKNEAHLLMRVHVASYAGLRHVIERARGIFDLGADPLQITAHLRRNRLLRGLVDAHPGMRIPGAWEPFELAVRAVLGQQVTVKGATTLAGRLVQKFGTPIGGNGWLSHLFPAPDVLADADLTAIGLPHARAATIRALAKAVSSGELSLDASLGLDDAVSRLCALPGIGAWTAHYIAMRALAEPDAFPPDDLGLRRAAARGKPLSAGALSRMAEEWRPWRGYAAMYLWNSLAGANKEGKS